MALHSTPMRLLGAAAALGAGYAAFLLSAQPRLLYMARSYDSFDMRPEYERAKRRFEANTGRELRKVAYMVGTEGQTSWVLVPRGKGNKRVWMFFGGNAMLALDWLETVAGLDERGAENDTFVLLDYPGYGENAGTPAPESVTLAALAVLKQLKDTEQLGSSVNLLGCSLGCAAALETAAAVHEMSVSVDKCILLCPFTSIVQVAAAHRVIPSFVPAKIANLLVRRETAWDNLATMARVLSRQQPQVHIFHGEQDEICPVHMGRELYKAALLGAKDPSRATFMTVPSCDHNSIVELAFEDIARAMIPSHL